MRLAAVGKAGFYPAAQEAVAGILRHLKMPEAKPEQVTMLDPCAGEGVALHKFAEELGVKPDRVYAVELDKARAAKVQEILPQAKVVHASFMGTNITNFSFGFVYLNPPFDDELGGGRREEETFLRYASAKLCVGGVLAFVLPATQLIGRRSIIELLDSRFEQIRVYKFPADHRPYREVVVLAKKRGTDLPMESLRTFGELHKQDWLYGNRYIAQGGNSSFEVNLPEIGQAAVKFGLYGRVDHVENEVYQYVIPPCYAPHTFKKMQMTDEEIAEALASSPLNARLARATVPPPKRPPLPLAKGHVALLLASGMLDGVVNGPDGPHVVRGTSRKEEYLDNSKTEEIVNSDGEQTGLKQVYSQRIVMTIRAVDASGVIKTFTDNPPAQDEEEGGDIRVKATVVDGDISDFCDEPFSRPARALPQPA